MRVATFTLHNGPSRKGTAVRLYRAQSTQFVVDFEGYPMLRRVSDTPERAVRFFAGWRDYSIKDWGATTVDWGDYEELAQYWPEDTTPWDQEI